MDYIFAIVGSETGKLIGNCWIHITSLTHKEARIGYCLNKIPWGKGYGIEVAKALVEFGFSKLDLQQIIC